jgi:hypothetical protein
MPYGQSPGPLPPVPAGLPYAPVPLPQPGAPHVVGGRGAPTLLAPREEVAPSGPKNSTIVVLFLVWFVVTVLGAVAEYVVLSKARS